MPRKEPPAIGQISMRTAKTYFGRMAMTNLYQLFITPGWVDKDGFPKFLENPKVRDTYNIDENFVYRNLGLLCSNAVLPASAYATSEIKDNFIGITQEFAHTRLYTDIDLEFYIDRDYKVLGFFECWMDYISGGGEIPLDPDFEKPGFYRRFNYPDYYKTNGIYIKKFEKDFIKGGAKSVTYRLKNAFPKSMSSIPVSYGNGELLKVSVTFNYDYYMIYRRSAVDLEKKIGNEVSDAIVRYHNSAEIPNGPFANSQLYDLPNGGMGIR